MRQSQETGFGRSVPLLIRIALQHAETAHVDDTRRTARAQRLPLLPVRTRLHVRQHSLTKQERRAEVRLHVRLPLLAGVSIIHGRAVLPVRGRDAAIVDQAVDAVVEELGRLGRCGAYLGEVA